MKNIIKSVRQGKLKFIAGFALGAVIFGGMGALAAGVIANPSTHKLVVDGTPVAAEAYNINGNNYFKLRDIAAAVDFGIDWDADSSTITANTSKSYVAEPSATPIIREYDGKLYEVEVNGGVGTGAGAQNDDGTWVDENDRW
jgi:hypothetical protein